MGVIIFANIIRLPEISWLIFDPFVYPENAIVILYFYLKLVSTSATN